MFPYVAGDPAQDAPTHALYNVANLPRPHPPAHMRHAVNAYVAGGASGRGVWRVIQLDRRRRPISPAER